MARNRQNKCSVTISPIKVSNKIPLLANHFCVNKSYIHVTACALHLVYEIIWEFTNNRIEVFSK